MTFLGYCVLCKMFGTMMKFRLGNKCNVAYTKNRCVHGTKLHGVIHAYSLSQKKRGGIKENMHREMWVCSIMKIRNILSI